jgi:hypothetical protein
MTQVSPSTAFEARLATTPADRRAVFKLRYLVYIEEMRRASRYANHDEKILEEPYDQNALIYGLFVGEMCVATVRANRGSDPTVTEYLDLYHISQKTTALSELVISTKVMANKSFRNLRAIRDFWMFFYEDLLERGFREIYCDCNDNVLRFFLHLGFKHSTPATTVHPEFGTVNLLHANMYDLSHAEAVGSPLATALKSYLERKPIK